MSPRNVNDHTLIMKQDIGRLTPGTLAASVLAVASVVAER
jgi:hypothetical protein